MKHPLLRGGDLLGLPNRIANAYEVIQLETELSDHIHAVRTLGEFLANAHVHVKSKLLLLEHLLRCSESSKEPQHDETRSTSKPLLCLAFITGDYFRDTMGPIVVWELRDVCMIKVQQQRDNKWTSDPWIETQRLCFVGSAKTPTNQDLKELYELHVEHSIGDPVVVGSLFNLRSRDDAVTDTNEAVKHVAVFLASLAISETKKIAALSFLLRNTEESRQAYQFCIDPEIDTSFFQERCFILWELRAICLYERQLQQVHHDKVMRAAGMAADVITTTAEGLHTVLSETTQLATTGMLSASHLVAHHVEDRGASVVPEFEKHTKTSVVVRTYLGAAKRATDHVRTVAAGTSRQIRDVSAHHIRQAATKISLPPAQKTNLQAVTHVTMACLGATATVGEAVFQSTGNLAQGATKAVSHVVQHAYGDTAGQVVQDVGDTVGNVIRTASHVALLTGKAALPKSVAKTTARQHHFLKKTIVQTGHDASSVVAETGLQSVEVSDTSMTENESSFSSNSSMSSSMVGLQDDHKRKVSDDAKTSAALS